MAIASGISLAILQMQSAQTSTQSAVNQRRSGNPAQSITDVDAQSSSIASPPSAGGNTGSKLNVFA